MGNWVDFKEIRLRVSLEDVIYTYYGIDNLKRQGKKLVGPCPVHGGDSPRAFHADLERNLYHCFSKCKRGGNQLDFVAAKEGISIRDAALRLQAFFLADETSRGDPQVSSHREHSHRRGQPRHGQHQRLRREESSSERSEKTPESKPEANPPLDLELKLKGDHPHLVKERGLAKETIEHFGIGYCSRGIMRGCIAIPIRDEHGTLVAYAGRRLKAKAIEEYGKYKLPKGFRKDLVLYNCHRAMQAETELGLILVEGYFSVLGLYEAGFVNVVASMGSELSDAQAELLKTAAEVTVLFDGNEAGYSGAETVRERLSSTLPVRIARLPTGTEPEDLSPDALRWLLAGMRSFDLAEISFTVRETKSGGRGHP